MCFKLVALELLLINSGKLNALPLHQLAALHAQRLQGHSCTAMCLLE